MGSAALSQVAHAHYVFMGKSSLFWFLLLNQKVSSVLIWRPRKCSLLLTHTPTGHTCLNMAHLYPEGLKDASRMGFAPLHCRTSLVMLAPIKNHLQSWLAWAKVSSFNPNCNMTSTKHLHLLWIKQPRQLMSCYPNLFHCCTVQRGGALIGSPRYCCSPPTNTTDSSSPWSRRQSIAK